MLIANDRKNLFISSELTADLFFYFYYYFSDCWWIIRLHVKETFPVKLSCITEATVMKCGRGLRSVRYMAHKQS